MIYIYKYIRDTSIKIKPKRNVLSRNLGRIYLFYIGYYICNDIYLNEALINLQLDSNYLLWHW